MSNETIAKLTIINRLLASFPATQSGSSDDVVDGYLLGTAEIQASFLAIAAQRFLAGSVPGQHMVFPPSPAQLATEAREHWYKALSAEQEQQRRLRPPSMDDVSDEERARVKTGFDNLAAQLAERLQTQETAQRRHKALLNKANARFAPDMSEAAMRRRLGFSAGDPDDHEAAA